MNNLYIVHAVIKMGLRDVRVCMRKKEKEVLRVFGTKEGVQQ